MLVVEISEQNIENLLVIAGKARKMLIWILIDHIVSITGKNVQFSKL